MTGALHQLLEKIEPSQWRQPCRLNSSAGSPGPEFWKYFQYYA